MIPADTLNTLRVTPESLRTLAEVLNQRDRMDELERKGRGNRGQARHAINPPREMMLEMHSEAIGKKSYVVYARDISTQGVSIMHGVFVAPNTRCVLTIKPLNGEVEQLVGVVRRCRLVGGRVHELGVKFEQAIDPGKYVVVREEGEAPTTPSEVDLRALLTIAKSMVAACEEKKPATEIAAMIDQARLIVAKAA